LESFQLAATWHGRWRKKSNVREPSNKPALVPKNIPLISNNLHKFAKIFFNRRRHFYRPNNFNFSRNLFYPNNLPPHAFSLPAFPIYGETNFFSDDHAIELQHSNHNDSIRPSFCPVPERASSINSKPTANQAQSR
jgi:hypothetical protein